MLGKNLAEAEKITGLLGIGLILFAVLIIGGLPLVAAVLYVISDGNPATDVNRAAGTLIGLDPLLTFGLNLAPFVVAFGAIALAVIAVHRRPFRSLITPGPRVRWRRIAQGCAAWLAVSVVLTVLEALLFPGRYSLTLDLPRLLPFTLVALVLLPLQTSAEELFFRGYLLQGLGLLNRQPLVLALLSGLLFAIPHAANPEVSADFWLVMGFYFAFGAALAWITLRDSGLELALGVHAANNLFTALFANFKGSALETPALFTATGFTPWFNLVGTVTGLVALGLVFVRKPCSSATSP